MINRPRAPARRGVGRKLRPALPRSRARHASAIESVEALRPDVVLLDVILPDIDGFEVAAALTRNGDPPVIVLTSSHDPRDFGTLIEESGARGFISKAELSPAKLQALLE